MKIGIIGPGEVEKYCKRASIDVSEYMRIVKNLACSLADTDNEIVVTPDRGSTSELFAQEYLNNKGKKVYVIVPLDDTEFGYSWVNVDLGENINCGTWRNQPEKLCEECDILICVGWGGGTLTEIYYTRWFGKVKRVYIVKELIDGKLPKSLEATFKILEYIKAKDLEKKLKAKKL